MSKLIPLPARNPDQHHRAATPLEIFFDLVFVIAIASVTAALHHSISEGHGVEVIPRFLFVFVAIWWSWMNFTWFASAFDNDGPLYRLLTMMIMVGALIFAGGTEHIFETLDIQWGILGWCIMRVAMAALWLRASTNSEYRTTCRRYAFGILFAQLCWVLLFFFGPSTETGFLLMAVPVYLIEFSVPPFAESAKQTPFHRHHIIERYGLLTMISMGEIMLSISLGFGMIYGQDGIFMPGIIALGAAIIVFSMWWLYFAETDHLPTSNFWTAIVWGYGHVFIFGAIAALGAGIAAELDLASHHSKVTQQDLSWWLGVPLAIFYVALWVTRDRHFDHGSRSYALPVMALVALIGSFLGLPTWGFAIIAVATVLWRVPMKEPVLPANAIEGGDSAGHAGH